MASLNSKEYDELIAVLKEARLEKRVSQELLSSKLGQSVNFILKIEHKDRRIDVVEFFELAKALEFDPQVLFARFVKRIT